MDCPLVSGTSTQLTCRIGLGSGLFANYPYNVDVLVANQGYALTSETYELRFVPKITSLSPNVGSVAGGTKIVIQGDGFLARSTVVFIDQYPFYVGNRATVTGSTIEIDTDFPYGTEGTVFLRFFQSQCQERLRSRSYLYHKVRIIFIH